METADIFKNRRFLSAFLILASALSWSSYAIAAEFEVVDKLSVNGSALFRTSATIIAPDTVPSSFWVSTSAVTPHLYVSTGGNVGIGTSAPTGKLHVVSSSTSDFAPMLKLTGNGNAKATLTLENTATGGRQFQIYNDSVGFGLYDFTAASYRWFILPGGNLGIGTTGPTHKLRVEGGILATSSITAQGGFYGDGTTLTGVATNPMVSKLNLNATPSLGTQNQAGISIDTHVFVTQGNVGIGTMSPGTLSYPSPPTISGKILHVNNGASGVARLLLEGTDTYLFMIDQNAAANAKIFGITHGGGQVMFRMTTDDGSASQLEMLRIDTTNGNVGIGTTGPTHKLRVEGGILATSSITAQAGFYGDGTTLTGVATNPMTSKLNLNATPSLGTQNQAGISIDTHVFITQGNVGIGTTGPGAKLEVKQDAASTYAVRVSSDNGTGMMVVQSNGNVGIGTASPGEKLDVSGRIRAGAVTIDSNPTNSDVMIDHWGSVIANPSAYREGLTTLLGMYKNTVGAQVNDHTAIRGELKLSEPNTQNWTGVLSSVRAQQDYRATATPTVITTARMFDAYAAEVNTNVTISNFQSFHALNPVGLGTITNLYGVYIDDLTKGTNNYALYAAGAAKSYFGGNVGIGTTGPTHKLRVEGGILATSSITAQGGFYGDGTTLTGVATNPMTAKLNINATPSLGTQNQAGISIDTHVFITQGNVGIGTTGPNYKLDINGDINLPSDYTIRFGGSAVFRGGSATRIFNSNNYISFDRFADGSPQMRILDNGRVGIGTTNPGATLDVTSSLAWPSPAIRFQSNAGDASLALTNTSAAGHDWRIASSGTGSTAAGGLRIFDFTAGTDRMVIDSAGNVGIGSVVSPGAKLEVKQAASDSYAVRVSSNDGGGMLVVQSNGNVGIGTTTPAEKLEITGNLRFTGSSYIRTTAGSLTMLPASGFTSWEGNQILQFTESAPGGSPSANNTYLYARDDGAGNTEWVARFNNGAVRPMATQSSTWSPGYSVVSFDGNVGIGTTTPSALLHVAGNVLVSTAVASPILFVSTTTGKIGIGTTGPASYTKLDVVGDYSRFNGLRLGGADYSNSVYMEGDSNTLGIATKSGDILLRPGEITRMVVQTNTGNVGIGTTGPTHKLRVEGGILATSSITAQGFYGDGANLTNVPVAASINVSTINATATTPYGGINVTTNTFFQGNVGIGTRSPSTTLHVTGPTTLDTMVLQDTSGNAPGLRFVNNGGSLMSLIGSNAANNILMAQSGAGTRYVFDMSHSGQATVASNATGMAIYTFPDATGTVPLLQNPQTFTAAQTVNNANLLVTGTGSVGIGTSSPGTAKLAISGGPLDMGSNQIQSIAGSGTLTGDSLHLVVRTGTNALDFEVADTGPAKMRIDNGGNVGIGTTGPGQKLEVAGTTLISSGGRVILSGDSAANLTTTDHQLAIRSSGGGLGWHLRAPGAASHLLFGDIGATTVFYVNSSGALALNYGANPGSAQLAVNGNVGIGTQAPGANLHISSTSAAASQDMLKVTTGTANADVFVVKGSGNVGLGLTGPTQKLDVNGDIKIRLGSNSNSNLWFTDAANGQLGALEIQPSGAFLLTRNSDTYGFLFRTGASAGNYVMNIPASGNVWMGGTAANTSPVMAVQASGNVGIGTTSPQAKLHVFDTASGAMPHTDARVVIERNNTAHFAVLTPNTSEGAIFFGDPQDSVVGGLRYVHSTNQMIFRVNGSDTALNINSAGNVGIGTTNPGAKLDVYTNGGGSLKIGYDGSSNRTISGGNLNGNLHIDGANNIYMNHYAAGSIYMGTAGDATDVHIGATSGTGKLSVSTSTTASPAFVVSMAGANAGNVGIATTTPQGLLHVGAGATPGLLVTSAGNVGIGTAGPNVALELGAGRSIRIPSDGQLQFGTDVGFSRTGTDIVGLLAGDILQFSAPSSGGMRMGAIADGQVHLREYVGAVDGIFRLMPGGQTTNSGRMEIYNNDLGISAPSTYARLSLIASPTLAEIASENATNPLLPLAFRVGAIEAIRIKTDGNVGIGTTAPNAKLEATLSSGDIARFGTDAANYFYIANDAATGFRMGAVDTAKSLALQTNGGQTRLFIKSDGNVGIGTTGPGAKLHAVETSGSSSYIFVASTATDSASYKMVVSTTGNVGIGTASPTHPLHITNSTLPRIRLDDGGGAYTEYGYIGGDSLIGNNYNDANADILFYTNIGGSYAERVRISNAGNVGIGTTGPGQALEVNGGVRVNTAAAQPACAAGTRGTFWVVQNGVGVKDKVEVCAKDATDIYAWRVVY